MGYFSNGTEGADYQARYCGRCANHDEDDGCEVLMVHHLWNDDQRKSEVVAGILGALIPRSKDGLTNLQCRMFRPR